MRGTKTSISGVYTRTGQLCELCEATLRVTDSSVKCVRILLPFPGVRVHIPLIYPVAGKGFGTNPFVTRLLL